MNGAVPAKSFLSKHSLPRVLVHLNRQRATGMLSVTAQGETKKIYFRRGNAIFASSTYEDDRLGEMLVKAGIIGFRQYEQAVEDMKFSGKRLGAVLVGLGILTADELYRGVKYQVKEIICRLFRLKDGLYEFQDGEPPPEVITLYLSMARIIHEGVRRIEDWTRIKSELPGPDTVLVFSDDPRSLFQRVELGHGDRKVLSLIDGDRSLKQVVEDSGLNAFDAMKSLYVLLTIGVITDHIGQAAVGLTLKGILAPVGDKREEFTARVEKAHSVLHRLSHHQLLGVAPSADLRTVKAKYYKLAKEFHPDRYGDSMDPSLLDKTIEVFDAITSAYEAIGKDRNSRQSGSGDMVLAGKMLENAKAEMKRGNYQRAVDYLEEAVSSDSGDADCWNYLSFAYAKLPGRLGDAEKALLEAVRLNPNRDDSHAGLGLIYSQTGRNREAVKEFERALSLNPGNTQARKGLSRLLAG